MVHERSRPWNAPGIFYGEKIVQHGDPEIAPDGGLKVGQRTVFLTTNDRLTSWGRNPSIA